MKFKKYLLSAVCGLLITGGLFASSVENHATLSAERSISSEIKTIIQKLDLNFAELDNQTVNIRFMVNEKHELIVLSTGDSDIDDTIKSALNYKEVDTKGIKPYNIYTVNVKFKAK